MSRLKVAQVTHDRVVVWVVLFKVELKDRDAGNLSGISYIRINTRTRARAHTHTVLAKETYISLLRLRRGH